MRILAALSGNAVLRPGEAAEAVAKAAQPLAALAAEHELVITHGDGARRLDVLGAESEGMVGQMLELALRNSLPDRDLVTILSEVVVRADDPAFDNPSKSIGPVYSADEARRLVAERGWSVGPDGSGFRRLVPSPEPQAIIEMRSLRRLVDAGVLVICADGGGIAVALNSDGTMDGVEAVVDRDLTASLLARRLDADLLLMLTDVDAVCLDWGEEGEGALADASPTELRERSIAAGSMGPKVEAACRFVEATGRRAAIGELRTAVEIARGDSGTQVSAHRA